MEYEEYDNKILIRDEVIDLISAKIPLRVLCLLHNQSDRVSTFTNVEISKILKCSQRAVSRAVMELKDKDFISVKIMKVRSGDKVVTRRQITLLDKK